MTEAIVGGLCVVCAGLIFVVAWWLVSDADEAAFWDVVEEIGL
jgi:hypothetical protein